MLQLSNPPLYKLVRGPDDKRAQKVKSRVNQRGDEGEG